MKQLTVTALEAIIDASGQGVMVIDVSEEDRPVVFVNDELARLTGVPRERRSARFECAIAFAQPDRVLLESSGRVAGLIIDEPRGGHGFAELA